jgi:hypothetical protein
MDRWEKARADVAAVAEWAGGLPVGVAAGLLPVAEVLHTGAGERFAATVVDLADLAAAGDQLAAGLGQDKGRTR